VVLVFNPSKDRVYKYNQMLRKVYDSFIEQTAKEYRAGTERLLEFIGSYFDKSATGDKHTYMLTTAYSNFVFTQDKVEGINYPSVPFGGNGFNVAFFSKIINGNRLRLLSVMKNIVRIELSEDGHLKFVEQNAINGLIDYDNGVLKWT
jgi:hypothetical protein